MKGKVYLVGNGLRAQCGLQFGEILLEALDVFGGGVGGWVAHLL